MRCDYEGKQRSERVHQDTSRCKFAARNAKRRRLSEAHHMESGNDQGWVRVNSAVRENKVVRSNGSCALKGERGAGTCCVHVSSARRMFSMERSQIINVEKKNEEVFRKGDNRRYSLFTIVVRPRVRSARRGFTRESPKISL